ncbi:MAG: hypothetical protein JWM65_3582 [Sphingomonas bacterium]|nr:hypothetical protein [Sphingomonas bacterium]
MSRSRFAFWLAVMLASPVLAQTHAAPLGEPVGETMPVGHRGVNPLFDLPANQKLISAFGERPVFSPDGTRIAFIGRSYGDAFEYDLRTGAIRNLTAHAPHNGFLRVHYLSDGSFILLGPRVPADTRDATRFSTIELFWMDAAAKNPPVPLQKTVFEGIAIGHQGNKIAWSELTPRASKFQDMKTTRIMTGRVVVHGNAAMVEQVENVLTLDAAEKCLSEPQDFYPGDMKLTLPCYHYVTKLPDGRMTDVMSLDLRTRAITIIPSPARYYGEVEGMFPDGKHTLVECSEDRSVAMDICVLELKPENPRYTRLTHIMDYGRWKYGNPVVSPDGRKVALQIGSADVADRGVGQGIVIIDLPPYR